MGRLESQAPNNSTQERNPHVSWDYLFQSLQLILEGLSGYLHFNHLLSEAFIFILSFSTLFLHGVKFMVQSDRYIFGYLYRPTEIVIRT